jgi:methylmalonyl-CoA mutase N-terminal domain/subunit
MRAGRDQAAVARALDGLRAVCRTDQNVMPAVIECVEAYATTGEICDVWREAFGEYASETARLGAGV